MKLALLSLVAVLAPVAVSFAQGGTSGAQQRAAQQTAAQQRSAQQSVATDVTPLPVLSRAVDLGPAPESAALTVSVSLPFARPDAAQAFADDVSDPRSPRWRKFITPEEVGARFGIPIENVQRIVAYLEDNGFAIALVSSNRLSVLARGTVAQAERAFHTEIREYAITPVDEVEPPRFIAPSTTLRLPAELAHWVIDVSGLDTYTRPRRQTTLTPALARGLYATAPMYDAGDTGAGRTVCVSNFDGFRAANWPLYISFFGLPVPAGGPGSNITVVPCNGGGSGAGFPAEEGDVDIQQELGMAPLATILVYDSPPSGDLIAVLAQEANDDQCDQISESYGWQLPASTLRAAHNLHLAMSAEGITYVAASGDTGTGVDPFAYPDMEPEVLAVGGTTAIVNGGTGARISEVGWSGSGGGWSTNPISFNVRPHWQVGNGVPAVNASNDHRLVPDVAFHAWDIGGAYFFFYNGALTQGASGTSFSAPLFAGCLCVIEQDMIALGGLPPDANGHRRFGRIQDYLYSQNGNPAIWFDITSGGNGMLPSGQGASTAHAGWDTVCGWGPMNCAAFAAVAACDTGGSCAVNPATPFCFGDGFDPLVTTPCPCFAYGVMGHGCANTADLRGAQLTATGTASPDTIVLTSKGEIASSLSVFLQGNATASSGILFGDGVRCVAGTMKRLYTLHATGHIASAPGPSDPSITAQSASHGDTILPGTSRYYQVYYRDPSSTCTGLGFNVSNGMKIDW